MALQQGTIKLILFSHTTCGDAGSPLLCSVPWRHRSLCMQGDPSAAPYAVENAKAVLGQKPVFGICMGHQVLGQAFGGTTFKLPFGHHGGNHPIRDVDTGKVQISAQNHNFAVDPTTLPEGVQVSHINLNDGEPGPPSPTWPPSMPTDVLQCTITMPSLTPLRQLPTGCDCCCCHSQAQSMHGAGHGIAQVAVLAACGWCARSVRVPDRARVDSTVQLSRCRCGSHRMHDTPLCVFRHVCRAALPREEGAHDTVPPRGISRPARCRHLL